MDTALKIPGPGRASCQIIHPHITKRLTLRSMSLERKYNFDSNKRKPTNRRISAMASNTDSKFSSDSLSLTQKVKQFYACINEKNLQKLDEYISSDAHFHDYSFTKPFQGKKVHILSYVILYLT